jgi:hypothetical protein
MKSHHGNGTVPLAVSRVRGALRVSQEHDHFSAQRRWWIEVIPAVAILCVPARGNGTPYIGPGTPPRPFGSSDLFHFQLFFFSHNAAPALHASDTHWLGELDRRALLLTGRKKAGNPMWGEASSRWTASNGAAVLSPVTNAPSQGPGPAYYPHLCNDLTCTCINRRGHGPP